MQTIPSPLIDTGCLLAARSVAFEARMFCNPPASVSDLRVRTEPPPTHSYLETTMDDEIRIQDLAADEIRDLLLEEGREVDEQQAAALKDFIAEIGGLENALAAVAMLGDLEEAA